MSTYLCQCGCGLQRCITCTLFDCQWPGECKGRCRECGRSPVRELHVVDDGDPLVVSEGCSFCSPECWRADHDRAVAEGLIVKVSDLTLEQLNEMFQRDGLALESVGPRKPS